MTAELVPEDNFPELHLVPVANTAEQTPSTGRLLVFEQAGGALAVAAAFAEIPIPKDTRRLTSWGLAVGEGKTPHQRQLFVGEKPIPYRRAGVVDVLDQVVTAGGTVAFTDLRDRLPHNDQATLREQTNSLNVLLAEIESLFKEHELPYWVTTIDYEREEKIISLQDELRPETTD